jgi:transcriptional regulator with XRE-family HTH domain
MTQRELAEHFTGTGSINAAQTRITNWETGRYIPSVSYLLQLANVFKVSLDWLITGRDDAPTEAPALPILNNPEEEASLDELLSTATHIHVPQELIDSGASFLMTSDPKHMRSLRISPHDYLAVKRIEEDDLPVREVKQRGKRRFFRAPLIMMKLWLNDDCFGIHVLYAARDDDGAIMIRPSHAIRRMQEEHRGLYHIEEVCSDFEIIGQVVGWIHLERSR